MANEPPGTHTMPWAAAGGVGVSSVATRIGSHGSVLPAPSALVPAALPAVPGPSVKGADSVAQGHAWRLTAAHQPDPQGVAAMIFVRTNSKYALALVIVVLLGTMFTF